MTSVLAIVGPTAVGKSRVALQLAERLDAEIVNADSMQGYIGMDVGTAKPSREDRQRVPHHVIDVWSPTQEISVVEFRDQARAAITDIHSRGRSAIVVGGSWLYVMAILDEMDFPPTDSQVRDRWQRELDRLGSHALHDRLAEVDPEAAAAIAPSNGRRMVRALEVVELTGSFTATLPTPTPWRETTWWGLDAPREHLDERIRRRVDAMWEAGFVGEVKRVKQVGFGATAAKALGYAQILRLLTGEIDETTAREETVQGTIRFARRQQRRFAQDARIHWLTGPDPVEIALRQSSSTS